MMKRRSHAKLLTYVGAVCLAGATATTWVTIERGTTEALHSPAFWVLLGLLFIGEVRPIRLIRGASGGEITLSTPFVFALLLKFGLGATVWGVAAACFAADMVHRKPMSRALFNAAQYALALTACGTVLRTLGQGRRLMTEPHLAGVDLTILLVAAFVFFILNVALPVVAVALDQNVSALGLLRRDFGYQLATAGVLIAASPVIVVAAQHSMLLLPTLLLPAAAVYWSSRVSLQNEHQSLHDSLTGLPNRILFDKTVTDTTARAESAAVMLLDLDHFKEVNDTLGHRMGDRLLVQVGERLHEVFGDCGVVARLGGDEFAMVINGADTHEALHTARAAIDRLHEPFHVEDYVLSVDASVGVAMYPAHGRDSDTLLRCADVAMYIAKDAHLGCQLYDSSDDRHSAERLALIGEMRRALDEDELVLYYQPKIDVQLGSVVGAEALVRWNHPERGLLMPLDFVPLIERTVHVGAFTLYIIEGALRQHRRWAEQGLTIPIAVNVPVTNLHDPSFPEKVAELLASVGVTAAAIEIEITETTIMADPVRAMTVLESLAGMGIALAVDDFGTGYSSLSYLKQMPVTAIKIDKSFVTDIATDAGDRTIANSTVTLAASLGLITIAEGVEDEASMQILRDIGCTQAQGYHIARPMPADDFNIWTGDRQRRNDERLDALVSSFVAVPAIAAASSREEQKT